MKANRNRPLPKLTELRLRRLRARLRLSTLSEASGIPLAALSEAERGLKFLAPKAQSAVETVLLEVESEIAHEPHAGR